MALDYQRRERYIFICSRVNLTTNREKVEKTGNRSKLSNDGPRVKIDILQTDLYLLRNSSGDRKAKVSDKGNVTALKYDDLFRLYRLESDKRDV